MPAHAHILNHAATGKGDSPTLLATTWTTYRRPHPSRLRSSTLQWEGQLPVSTTHQIQTCQCWTSRCAVVCGSKAAQGNQTPRNYGVAAGSDLKIEPGVLAVHDCLAPSLPRCPHQPSGGLLGHAHSAGTQKSGQCHMHVCAGQRIHQAVLDKQDIPGTAGQSHSVQSVLARCGGQWQHATVVESGKGSSE